MSFVGAATGRTGCQTHLAQGSGGRAAAEGPNAIICPCGPGSGRHRAGRLPAASPLFGSIEPVPMGLPRLGAKAKRLRWNGAAG